MYMGDLIWNGLSHNKGLPTLPLKVQKNSYCPYIVLFRTTATMLSSDLRTEKWDKNYCIFSKVFTVVCKGFIRSYLHLLHVLITLIYRIHPIICKVTAAVHDWEH